MEQSLEGGKKKEIEKFFWGWKLDGEVGYKSVFVGWSALQFQEQLSGGKILWQEQSELQWVTEWALGFSMNSHISKVPPLTKLPRRIMKVHGENPISRHFFVAPGTMREAISSHDYRGYFNQRLWFLVWIMSSCLHSYGSINEWRRKIGNVARARGDVWFSRRLKLGWSEGKNLEWKMFHHKIFNFHVLPA